MYAHSTNSVCRYRYHYCWKIVHKWDSRYTNVIDMGKHTFPILLYIFFLYLIKISTLNIRWQSCIRVLLWHVHHSKTSMLPLHFTQNWSQFISWCIFHFILFISIIFLKQVSLFFFFLNWFAAIDIVSPANTHECIICMRQKHTNTNTRWFVVNRPSSAFVRGEKYVMLQNKLK